MTAKELEEIRERVESPIWHAWAEDLKAADVKTLLAEVDRLRGIIQEMGTHYLPGSCPDCDKVFKEFEE